MLLFLKAVKHLPRTNVHEVLQLLIAPYLEDAPILSCPEGIDNSHSKRLAGLICNKFLRILLINHAKTVTDRNEKSAGYVHKPSRKHFRL